MRTRSTSKGIAILCACVFLFVLAGCAGLEYAPKRTVLYYHKELPAAERAVEAARAAGKDKECPTEFQAAEKAKNEAYEIYWSCRTKEGIAKANEASAMAKALCPPKPVPMMPPPPPPPPPLPPMAPPPNVSLSANPPAVDAGKCTTLSGHRKTRAARRSTRGSETSGERVAPGVPRRDDTLHDRCYG